MALRQFNRQSDWFIYLNEIKTNNPNETILVRDNLEVSGNTNFNSDVNINGNLICDNLYGDISAIALSINSAYILPSTIGSANQVLTVPASGNVLTFTDNTSGWIGTATSDLDMSIYNITNTGGYNTYQTLGTNKIINTPSNTLKVGGVNVTAINKRTRTSHASAVKCVSTWITQTSAADNNLNSVCWAPELGLFCAVAATGTGNRVMTSPDGITWTIRTSAANNFWTSVCWAAELGLFCAVSSTGTGNRVMTSPDGITWTTRTSAADNFWNSVCWAAELGLFCAVAESGVGNRVMTSPDGITWTTQTSAVDNDWFSVCWAAELGLFCAVASSGVGNRVMTSPDGITWTAQTSAADNFWTSVCWAAELGLFCAVAASGVGNRVMTSPDGITWTTRTSAAEKPWKSICWAPELGLFCAISWTVTANLIMTSPDGITWTTRTSAADSYWTSICWAPELSLFCAVAESGIGNRVMTTKYKIFTSKNLNSNLDIVGNIQASRFIGDVSASALTVNSSYKLPSTIGSANQVLTVPASGNVLTFTTPSAGGATEIVNTETIKSTNSLSNATIGGLAIGYNSGNIQGNYSVALGYNAGYTSQAGESVAVGGSAGRIQLTRCVALGFQAGDNQNLGAVAIGYGAASGGTQSQYAISIGYGSQGRASNSIAIGYNTTTTSTGTIAIGNSARANQDNSISIGSSAGVGSTGYDVIGIGTNAGKASNDQSIAIGSTAGFSGTRGTRAIAIGNEAGFTNQGAYTIALGNQAGYQDQSANTIILNATGTIYNGAHNSGLYVKPVSNKSYSNALYYDPTSGEITYDLSGGGGGGSWVGTATSDLDMATYNITTTRGYSTYRSLGTNKIINVPSNALKVGGVNVTAINKRTRTSHASSVKCVSTWTTQTSAADNGWRSVCWAAELGLFCAVADTGTGNRVMTSPDGITWTTRTSAADNGWLSVCWAAELGLFCAVSWTGTGNRVMTSPDGITWTIRTSAADNNWVAVCWAPELGLFCAVASSGTGNRVMTSPDGITWTSRTSAADNGWTSVCWAAELGLFCAVASTGTGNRVMTSSDGITWTTRTSAANNFWRSVCWAAELGLFCAVSWTGTGNRVMTSPDGINWTTRTSAADIEWLSVCWAPELGLFCAVSYTGIENRVMTSPDGIIWTTRTGADNFCNSVCWAAELGIFCAVATIGTGNRVMTTKYKIFTSKNLNSNLDIVGNIQASRFIGDISASALTVNSSYKLPSTIGSANQVLTVPASGNILTFTDNTSGWVGTATTDLNMSNFNITGINQLQGASTMTIDPAGVGDNTGLVVIKGNLQVDGTTTTINSSVLDISDHTILLASAATNVTQTYGAGIEISGNKTFTYESGDIWNSNIGITAPKFTGDICANALSVNSSYILPTTIGTANQVLTVPASGNVLTFTTPSSVWVGTATSNLNMSGYKITNVQDISINNNLDIIGKVAANKFTGDISASALTVNSAYKMPTTIGTANQVLTVPASGNTLTFTTPSTGGATSIVNTSGLKSTNATDASSGAVALGLNSRAFTDSVSLIGTATGLRSTALTGGIASGNDTISIGTLSSAVGVNTVAIGNLAGYQTTNTNYCLFIGRNTGWNCNAEYNTYIGNSAGFGTASGSGFNTYIGANVGADATGSYSVGIGYNSGRAGNTACISIGRESGNNGTRGTYAIAMGYRAGYTSQGEHSFAIGSQSGESNQVDNSISIGRQAGQFSQQWSSIAIGTFAGQTTQGTRSLALGYNAGNNNLGDYSLAIGNNACSLGGDFSSCIVFNAQGNDISLNPSISGQFLVKPIRNVTSVSNGLFYNPTTGEISYDTAAGGSGATSIINTQTLISSNTGTTTTGDYSVILGFDCNLPTGVNNVIIGRASGNTSGYSNMITLGNENCTSGGQNAIAIGNSAGKINCGNNSVSIGYFAGQNNLNANAIAIGNYAGQNNLKTSAIAIGYNAGAAQGLNTGTISIGVNSGYSSTAEGAVYIGDTAGNSVNPGNTGNGGICIGRRSGDTRHREYCVTIGDYAGGSYVGAYTIAIGANAARNSASSATDYSGCIVFNAQNTGAELNPSGNNQFMVKTRTDTGLTENNINVALCYDAGTGIITKSSAGYFNVSDNLFKYQEKNIINALDIINKLQPVNYVMTISNYKNDNGEVMKDKSGNIIYYNPNNLEDGKYGEYRKDWYYEAGFVAQDVNNISELQQFVNPGDTPDKFNSLEYKRWTLSYNSLFTYNVAATQELSKQLDIANNKIQHLENKMNNILLENDLLKSKLNILLELNNIPIIL